ncbi:MAG: sugar ABC transporter ATP-binding protein [Ignavibacteriaceae bacterium]
MENISKHYPGVLALDDVSFELGKGEVHCLLGENGAGKSTLMKILSGALKKDAGKIFIGDKEVDYNTPSEAQKLGIGIIYQDFKLIPELTAADNIFLGSEILKSSFSFLDKRKMNELAQKALKELGEEIRTDIPVNKLSVAQRQMIEIVKSTRRNIRILAMDEPTASLTTSEIENLFKVIRKLKSEGVGIIYISHRLEEIFEIGDRVTVMRDGKIITTSEIKDTNIKELIRQMVGRELADEFPKHSVKIGEDILNLEDINRGKLKNINLKLRKGEILGLAGLVGAGRSEVARVIFGADKIEKGRIIFDGREQKFRSPKDAINAGIALLTEDRNLYGLFMERSIRENISISNLSPLMKGMFIDKAAEEKAVGNYFDQLQIKAPTQGTKVENLSGGNRQKVVLARWLHTHSKIIIFDEPTAGIDVGVKFEIYSLINKLVEQGMGVIVISSELPELIGISDRIVIMCEGRITGELMKEEFSQEKILKLATQALEKTYAD